jgi:GT2 family glycosyltransferase
VARPALPSFDLVVATVERTAELDEFLASVADQAEVRVRILVVDQNDDDRVAGVLARHGDLRVEHLRSPCGLSRARNVALPRLAADLVAFPDDDCIYPPEILEEVAGRFAADPTLDGLTGRTVDAAGANPERSKPDSVELTDDNLWNRGSSATLFLRAETVRRVGQFDESLGVGSGTPWASAEEVDYLIRAVHSGARIVYNPSLAVRHALRVDDTSKGLRDGLSVGYLLRKHRYPPPVLARMLVRPVGGALLALLRHDTPRAHYYAATARGRIRGYLRSSSKSSR